MSSDATQTADRSFDDVVLPYLGAAHRLARWLLRNQHDAEDAVQDALLRALIYFRTFAGGNGRAWFLSIVRNTCYLRRSRYEPAVIDAFEEERHTVHQGQPNPETLMLRADDAARIDGAIAALPLRAREVIVLREFEGLSYQEVAEVLDIPAGTVMSTLSRARRALRATLRSAELKSPREHWSQSLPLEVRR